MKKLLILLALVVPTGVVAEGRLYDRVVISVNEFAITQQQIELKLMTAAAARGINASDKKTKDQFYKQSLKDLEEEALIESRAKDLGIEIPDAMLEDEVDRFIKQRRLTRLGFEMLLEEQGQNVSEYKHNLAKKMIRDRVLMMEVETQVILSDSRLKKMFVEEGQKTMKAHARHILILVDQKAPLKVVEKARAKLMGIRAKLLKGANFNKLADQHSQDPSVKNNHGDLGFFASGQMVAPFSKAAFSLPIREVSMPVRTSYGFHIIEVLERREFESGSFEKVRRQFQQAATQKLYTQKYGEYIEKLRSKAHIQYH